MRTSRLLLASSILSLSLSAGCDPVTPTEDSGPGTDTGGTDTGGVMTDTGETPTDAGSDGGGGTGCGTARPDVAAITGTEGLIIARDGTIYYSQSRAVGRLAPGGSPENGFVALPSGAGTVWGIALDAANETLYVGSPTAATIYSVDLTAATPTATVFVASAGGPNGLTVGPDGALYYSDFGGNGVRRVAATGGAPTNVTTSPIAQANGVAFDAEGRLLVASYATGTLFRLTLTAGAETGRETVATGLGSPDGVAVDANGDYWVTDNRGTLLSVDAATGTRMNALPGISSAASLDFGAGPLNCQDIYIASGGAMRRYEASGVDGADVLWH